VVLLKLDWQVGSRPLSSARYNRLTVPDNRNMIAPGEEYGWSNDGRSANDYDSAVLSLNSVLSPRLMNEAFVQYSVERGWAVPNSSSSPAVRIHEPARPSGYFGQHTSLPTELSENRWQVVNNLSYSVGKHVLRGGINFDFVSFEQLWSAVLYGYYEITTWDDFLDRGEPWQYTQAFSTTDGWNEYDGNTYAAYLQDEWRAAPNLSLIYGLRYDYQHHDQPTTINPLYPLTGQIPNDRDNVSARFGVAWDPSGDGKAVLRGGIGLFYDPTPARLDVIARSVNGINQVLVSARCSQDPCPTYPDRWVSIADVPPGLRPWIYVYDPQFENPQTLRMSLGYEREIFTNFSVGIDFVYSKSRDLQTQQDQNLVPTDELTVDGRTVYESGTVYPDLDQVIMYRSDGRAIAKSLVLTAHKRFSDRWFLDASYTWSDIRNNGTNSTGASRFRNFRDDQYDIDAEWGPADFDVRHKIVVSGGVYLPYRFMISGYVFARSGFPYSAFHDWPDLNRDGYRESDRSVIETQDEVYYHYPRNTFRQPWIYTTNLRLSKSFRLGRGTEIEIIGEVFNLFDRANRFTTIWELSWGCRFEGDQCGTWDDFGELNRVGKPRQYQFGLRLRF
jgi:outer membrane receptor protein involved in Fe transport